jgi:hypothetical protein
MFDFEVVVLELCVPAGCAMIEFLRFLPVEQVCVVHADDEGFFCPDDVRAPVGDCFDDCK